jgi:hypothetical protein
MDHGIPTHDDVIRDHRERADARPLADLRSGGNRRKAMNAHRRSRSIVKYSQGLHKRRVRVHATNDRSAPRIDFTADEHGRSLGRLEHGRVFEIRQERQVAGAGGIDRGNGADFRSPVSFNLAAKAFSKVP